MRGLDIDLLRVFVAIADTNSFTGAGQRLYRTQSTISLQLQRLEKMMDCRLLRRAQGHVDGLTSAGNTLLAYAREMIRLNELAAAALEADRIEGNVCLGLADEAAHGDLSNALARFQSKHPSVHLEVICASSGELVEWIHTRRIQLALINRCDNEPISNVDTHRLYSERLTWVMANGGYRSDGGPVPLVSFPPGCAYRARAIQALESQKRPWRSLYTSGSRQGVWSAVSAGLGVAALPVAGVPQCQPGIKTGATIGLCEPEPVEVSLLSSHASKPVEPQRSLQLCIQKQFADYPKKRLWASYEPNVLDCRKTSV